MAMEAEWYRRQGHKVYWGRPTPRVDLEKVNLFSIFSSDDCIEYFQMKNMYFDKTITEPEGLLFLSLPAPDRVFTRAKEYTSGNYKHLPGTHIQVANGCWWGKCSFCIEQNKPYEVRRNSEVCLELVECKKLGFREIFDDSGTFPIGEWLEHFCWHWEGQRMTFGCNMRMVDEDYTMMKRAGFRILLFGLESANQNTLDKINKGVKVEDYKYIIKAWRAGLEPHVSVMFGYPWETDRDALNTLHLVWYLLRKGYAKTAQASFFTCPGAGSNENHRKYIRQIYSVWKSPKFWFRQIKDIKDKDDLKYLWRKIKAGLYDYKSG